MFSNRAARWTRAMKTLIEKRVFLARAAAVLRLERPSRVTFRHYYYYGVHRLLAHFNFKFSSLLRLTFNGRGN